MWKQIQLIFIGVCLVLTVTRADDNEFERLEDLDDIDVPENGKVNEPAEVAPVQANNDKPCSLCEGLGAERCEVEEKTTDDTKTIITNVKCIDTQGQVLKKNTSSRNNKYPGVHYQKKYIEQHSTYTRRGGNSDDFGDFASRFNNNKYWSMIKI